MGTALWVTLCGVGLLVGVIVGFGLRRRHAISVDPTRIDNSGQALDPEADPSPEPTPDTSGGIVIDSASFGSGKPRARRRPTHDDGARAAVIDLRRPADNPPPVTQRETEGSPVADPPGSIPDKRAADDVDAQIIDLRDRVTTPVPVHNLQFIHGIGPLLDFEMRRLGVVTLQDLAAISQADAEGLAEVVPELTAKKVRKKLRGRARTMLAAAGQYNIAQPPDTSGLRRVDGIGSTMARWLETRGITTLDQLAALDETGQATLQGALPEFPDRIATQQWVKQARHVQVKS
jgi:predicted flap endonuclease-1-like 5' DNA nuclease